MTLKLRTDLHNGCSRITSIHSTKRLVLQPWIRKSLWLSKIKLNHFATSSVQHSLWTMTFPFTRVGHWLMQPLNINRQHLKSLLWTITHNKPATVINNYLLYLTIFPNITQQSFIHLYKTIDLKKGFVKLNWYCIDTLISTHRWSIHSFLTVLHPPCDSTSDGWRPSFLRY